MVIFKTTDGGGVSGIKENNYHQNNIPTQIELYQNYPNPFNPSTIISYKLTNPGFVSLKVYDILGRVVDILVNEQKQQGRYDVNFDASKLASGIYFYQLKVIDPLKSANNFISTKKMLLIK